MESFSDELKRRFIDYLLQNGADLSFTKRFWRDCEPLPIDISQYSKFVEVLTLYEAGVSRPDICLRTQVKQSTVYAWTRLTCMPKPAHFLKAFLLLGEPTSERVWLTVEQTHGHALPIGRFVQVPMMVNSWLDVEMVINQARGDPLNLQGFDIRYLFGFLLGMMIGDAAKSRQGRGHRHIGLVLSKKYDTNLKIGDFTCRCAMALGLRMHRAKDHPKPLHKPHEFFEWTSQASPLIDWIFNVALGLNDGDLTTYDAIQADWVLEAPREFRLGLVQGLAESDGSVSIASQEVEFWVDPHRSLLKRLLETFGLHGFNNRQAFTLSKTQAIKSFDVPVFSPVLQSVRYKRLELMASCKKLTKKERLSEEVRNEIMDLRRSGMSVPKIVETIASSRRLLVSFETAQRWARKAGPLLPRGAISEERLQA